MRIEILTRIGFEPRTQTPGAVLAVPGDASSLEVEDWLARGLVRVLEEPLEVPAAEPLEEPLEVPAAEPLEEPQVESQRATRRKERP